MVAMPGHFAGEGRPERSRFSGLRLPKDLPVSLPSEVVVRQRPDVRAVEANLHAATAQVGVAIANRLPQFNLTANAGTTGALLSNLASLSSPASAFWALVASASQVLFDGFSRAQRQRAAEAGLDEAAAQYRSTVMVPFATLRMRSRRSRRPRELCARRNGVRRPPKKERRGQSRSVPVRRSQHIAVAQRAAELSAGFARRGSSPGQIAMPTQWPLFQARGGGWWNRAQPGTTRVSHAPMLETN
jgi:hypothetical protein